MHLRDGNRWQAVCRPWWMSDMFADHGLTRMIYCTQALSALFQMCVSSASLRFDCPSLPPANAGFGNYPLFWSSECQLEGQSTTPSFSRSLSVQKMSYPTSFPTLSRSSSQIRNDLLHDYKPFEPWCLLLNESQPDVSMVQVPLMDPETCTKELVCVLLHDYFSLAMLTMHTWEAIPSCSCMGPER